jgi:hypothetical protein
MINIKRFIDKVSLMDARHSSQIVLPESEARGLRDEICKLLADLKDMNSDKKDDKIISVEVKGGSFK